jgi:hypothetical protein
VCGGEGGGGDWETSWLRPSPDIAGMASMLSVGGRQDGTGVGVVELLWWQGGDGSVCVES